MKNFLLSAVMIATLISACQDSNSNFKTKDQNAVLNKAVGQQIPVELANKWIAAYNKQSGSGRTEQFQYRVTAQPFDAIITSVPILGLAFHHAIDDSGNPHVLILAIDENEKLWSTQNDRICIDATTNALIDEGTARNWTQNFKDRYPDDIWYHFFGENILLEMRNVSWFTEFEIIPALNDDDLYQLLLVINNSGSTTGGRVKAESIVYDKTVSCPPSCGADN